MTGAVTEGDRALTGLRGAAALLVAGHHLYLRGHLHVPLLNDLAVKGYLAVDLFFVLSGFVMALAYGDWFERRVTPGAYIEFMARRVARLWPLHATVLLIILAVQAATGAWYAWPKMILANVLMVQSWGFSQAVNAPSWSVSTEMLAYLLFPALAGMALHGRRGVAWGALALAVGLLLACILLAPDRGAARRGALDIYDNWSVLPAMRCLGGFTVGLLTFRTLRTPWVAALAGQPAVGLGAGVGALALLALGAPDLLIYLLLPILVAATFVGRGRFQAALGSPAIYGLGVLSYAIYLAHVPILEWLAALLGADPLVLAPAFLMTTVLVAIAAHTLIERPGRAMLRRVPFPRRPLQAEQGSSI